MADDDRIRTLLRAASAIDEPATTPVDRLVARGHRAVARRRIALAALTVCAVAGVVVVPTVLITNRSHRDTAAGPTDPTTPSASSNSPSPTSPTSTSLTSSSPSTPTSPVEPSHTQTPNAAYPTAGPGTAASLALAHWSAMPDAPIAGRSGAASVWTGEQMLIWGGSTSKGDRQFGDGASYDPATHTWRVLPAAPLSPRAGVASVWTGTQWFLWGGGKDLGWDADGAVFDPSAGTWTALPPSPLAGRSGATAVWTGNEVIVVGGSWGSGVLHAPADGAAYNPATGRWRLLAANNDVPPHDLMYVTATATGTSVLVAYEWSKNETTTDGGSITSGVLLSTYDPEQDTWNQVSNSDPHQEINQLIWTGREVIVPAGQGWCGVCPGPFRIGTQGRRLDVATGQWRDLPHGRLDDFARSDVWTGAALVVPIIGGQSSGGADGTVTPGDAVAWDATTNAWVVLPKAPAIGLDVSLWTGKQLLVWGLPYVFGATSSKGVGAALG